MPRVRRGRHPGVTTPRPSLRPGRRGSGRKRDQTIWTVITRNRYATRGSAPGRTNRRRAAGADEPPGAGVARCGPPVTDRRPETASSSSAPPADARRAVTPPRRRRRRGTVAAARCSRSTSRPGRPASASTESCGGVVGFTPAVDGGMLSSQKDSRCLHRGMASLSVGVRGAYPFSFERVLRLTPMCPIPSNSPGGMMAATRQSLAGGSPSTRVSYTVARPARQAGNTTRSS